MPKQPDERYRILWVDDNPGAISHLILQLIEDLPASVSCASTAQSAEHKLSSEEFDLVILDLMIPGIGNERYEGLVLLNRIKRGDLKAFRSQKTDPPAVIVFTEASDKAEKLVSDKGLSNVDVLPKSEGYRIVQAVRHALLSKPPSRLG